VIGAHLANPGGEGRSPTQGTAARSVVAKEQPSDPEGARGTAPPKESKPGLSWRGVRLARRDEEAAGRAATEEATPPDGHLAATDLVAEVAAGCKYHRDAVFIRRVDHFLVPD
jgi:hypothetical protein